MKKSNLKMTIKLAAMLCCFASMVLALPLQVPMEDDDLALPDDQSPAAVERWFRFVLPFSRPKFTKFRLYYHEYRVADVPTAVEIARANMTTTSPTGFGSTYAIDDPLTVGPESDSAVVGRAQGIYSSASQGENAFILEFNVVFTAGEFTGSTLSVLGRDPIGNQFRELSILGGSGAFRLARGAIATHTYSLDTSTLNAVVEYNFFVQHY